MIREDVQNAIPDRVVWHPDYSHLHAPEPLFGVKVFAFFADVRPRSGGTLAIAGSHRVLARFAQSLPPEVRRDGTRFMPLFFKHDDWFRSLSRPGGDPERAAGFMDSGHQAGGIAVRVMELTGRSWFLPTRGCCIAPRRTPAHIRG